MSENSVSEIDKSEKEVVAETPPDRQNLIDTAVRFLQNPKVIPTPLESKKQFLMKKGLNQSEIESALSLAGTSNTHSMENSMIKSHQIQHEQQISNMSPRQFARKTPIWITIARWIRNFLLAGCLAYTAYKLIVKRYLFSSEKKNSSSEKLIKSNEQLLNSVQEMRVSLNSLKETVEIMNSIVQSQTRSSSKAFMSDETSTSLKTEVQSIKNLLLSRSQFPGLPNITPIIPSWQLENKTSTNTDKSNFACDDSLNENDAADKDYHKITKNTETDEVQCSN